MKADSILFYRGTQTSEILHQKRIPPEAGSLSSIMPGVYMVIESTLVHFVDKLAKLISFFQRKAVAVSISCNNVKTLN